MGISVNATATAANALSKANIPMIGSVDTGDTLDWTHVTGLAQVAVTSNEEVTRTTGYLKAHGGLGTDFLVSDNDKSDRYTSGLANDFLTALGTQMSGEEPYGPGPESGNEFALIADDVCGIPGSPSHGNLRRPRGSPTPPRYPASIPAWPTLATSRRSSGHRSQPASAPRTSMTRG